jgi:hypothetical protein
VGAGSGGNPWAALPIALVSLRGWKWYNNGVTTASFASFLDELQKIAASIGRAKIPKSRSGRRPMSVDTMLRKDKEGTLYNEHKTASAATAFTSSDAFPNDSLGGPGPQIGRPASAKRKEYDAPTQDEPAAYPKQDNAQTNRSLSALSPALDQLGRS